MRILKIIETAHRATLEELAHSLRGAGAPIDVLLRGNAVNHLERDLASLAQEGVAVFYQEEDAAARGLLGTELLDGAQPISHSALPELLGRYDQVWHF